MLTTVHRFVPTTTASRTKLNTYDEHLHYLLSEDTNVIEEKESLVRSHYFERFYVMNKRYHSVLMVLTTRRILLFQVAWELWGTTASKDSFWWQDSSKYLNVDPGTRAFEPRFIKPIKVSARLSLWSHFHSGSLCVLPLSCLLLW